MTRPRDRWGLALVALLALVATPASAAERTLLELESVADFSARFSEADEQPRLILLLSPT